MEEALRALLAGYPPLTALVLQRIYWNAIPQDTPDPAVVIYKIDGAPGLTMAGPDALERARVQVDVRAITVNSAWAVKRAIVERLSGFKGSSAGVVFGGIFLDSERQSSEKPGTQLYQRVSLDFEVWFRPA